MKISHPVFGLVSKAVVFSVVSGLGFTACTRRSSAPEELPSGRYVKPEVPVTPAQNKSLKEEFESQLSASLESIFASDLSSDASSDAVHSAVSGKLTRAMAIAFAKDVVARIDRSTSTNCVANPDRTGAYLSCLVFEVVDGSLSNAVDATRWISSFSRVKDSSGKAVLNESEAAGYAQSAPAALVRFFGSPKRIENMLSKLSRELESSIRALEILSMQQVSLDMPYLADSFIKNRRYILTTSLQQGSVGTARVFNLDSMVVKFQVNSNRLVIIRSGEGLYDGSSQEDLIVGSYPIVRTVEPVGEKQKYYQVDFSRPENKSFLVSAFAGGEPSLQMSADVVVPRVAHAAKPALGLMTNGLYFTEQDPSLVIDQLVLINANDAVLGEDDDVGPIAEPSKDPIRPTVHVVQGFFPLPSGQDAFEAKQALPLDVSQQELRTRGVNDRTEGKDVPYFSTKGMFEANGGRATSIVPYVRKFNLEKEITFVLSRNVPQQLVPVLKSAVLSYKELFDGLATDETPAPAIRVYSQDEFEELNRAQGLATGGSVIAADPRVNMIYWDDSLALGSAWATASENPKTGEIISGDVMLSGTMWAMEGCKGYFQRTWQKSKEPNLPKRPSGSVPSPVSRFLWEAKCDAALTNLGIFKSRAAPAEDLTEFDRANRSGDLVTLARHASKALGRKVSPKEMISELSHAGQGKTASAQELADAYAKLKGSSAGLKRKVEDRQRSLDALFKAETQDSQVQSMKSGRNVVRAKLDCVRHLMPNAEINLSESGAPGIESPFVTSPETGALALVRSVVVHELGHIFGLRHNFIASTTPTEFAEDAKTPVTIDKGTDSVMDYNDYGIEMTAGAMRDFAVAESASGLGTFGAYDVLALATAYGYPTDGMKFKTPPAFCTDRNVGTFGNCQRFDFGKDYNEYLMLRVNLILQRLRYANPMDAILDPRLPTVYAQLISTLSQELLKVNALWGIAQSAANESSQVPVRDALLQTAEFAFRGVGGKQQFLQKFSDQHGSRLQGAYDALRIESSFFADPSYGALISGLIRREMDLNMIAVARVLQTRAKAKGSDAAYLGVISNISHRGVNFAYLDELITHFGQRVVLPAGSTSEFEYFDENQRKSGSDATLDGKPFALTLDKPLFNHQNQVVVVPNVVLDGPAPGSRKTVTALVKGRHSIDDMVQAIAALSVMAGDNPLHPAQSRLGAQAEALQQLLQLDVCPPLAEDFTNAVACESLKAEARAPAAIILNAIMSVAQGALPTMSVASGDGL